MKRTVKEWRAHKDMTQKQLAEIINVRPATIGAWENGEARPRFENHEKLAKVFNTDIGNIIFLSSNRILKTKFSRTTKNFRKVERNARSQG